MAHDRNFRYVDANGITLRTVVEGDGPLVVMLHGWPQGWNFWRNQIDPVVAAGYKVAVPELRGYGESSKPEDREEYNILKLAGDVPALAKALGYDEFKLIGHDWGCIVAWNTALLHEDTCTAVMGLSVPFWYPDETIIDPPGADDKFWFMRYLQDDEADVFMDANAREFLQKIYFCLSNDSESLAFMKQFEFGRDSNIIDFLPKTDKLPSCISEEEFEYSLAQFKKGGFRGPNNYYRNLLQHQALTPELSGKKFSQPAAFVYGENDDVPEFVPGWKEDFRNSFEDLHFIEVVDNAAHWVHLEQPEETNKHILRFLKEVS